jgi:hypothetical protein
MHHPCARPTICIRLSNVLPDRQAVLVYLVIRVAAAGQVQLSADELRRLDETFPVGAAAGTRYPEGGMKAVNR